jgi:5-methylcytosine-specific restriction endonuclease McrA
MSEPLSRDERIRIKKLLLRRDGENCGICGRYMKPDDRTIDHILELKNGGTNDMGNLRLAHKLCNSNRQPE